MRDADLAVPGRSGDRLRALVYAARKARVELRRRRLDYAREERARTRRLAAVLDADEAELEGYEREYDDLGWFHEPYSRGLEQLHDAGVATDTTHWRDGKTLYVLCRALEPDVVVETGVRFGSFDAHAVAALERNGHGEFHGLDLPGGPEGHFEYGHLVPEACRDRWTLHTGDARAVLPDLLADLAPVDLFVHDSNHRKPHMRFEFETAYLRLRPGGVLASHDVRLSSLFEQFADERGMTHCTVCDTGVARRSRTDDAPES